MLAETIQAWEDNYLIISSINILENINSVCIHIVNTTICINCANGLGVKLLTEDCFRT